MNLQKVFAGIGRGWRVPLGALVWTMWIRPSDLEERRAADAVPRRSRCRRLRVSPECIF